MQFRKNWLEKKPKETPEQYVERFKEQFLKKKGKPPTIYGYIGYFVCRRKRYYIGYVVDVKEKVIEARCSFSIYETHFKTNCKKKEKTQDLF